MEGKSVEGWATWGRKTVRDEPSQRFLLTEAVLQSMLADCMELFPPAVFGLLGRKDRICRGAALLERKDFLPDVFAVYCIRSEEYLADVLWTDQEGHEKPVQTCHDQIMCEETAGGRLLLRIYESQDTENGKRRMTGGAVVDVISGGETPETMRYRYRAHDREASYTLPVFRLEELGAEEITEKRWAFFLPFWVLAMQAGKPESACEMQRITDLVSGMEMKEETRNRLLQVCGQVLEGGANRPGNA